MKGTELEQVCSGVSNQNKNQQSWVNRKHQSRKQKIALEKARSGASARCQTCWRACERSWTRTWQLSADSSNTSSDGRGTGASGPHGIFQIPNRKLQNVWSSVSTRADMTFIVSELCQRMSIHTHERLVRDLKRETQWIQILSRRRMSEEVTTHSDTDWVSCKKTRKPSSAGVILLGNHMLQACNLKQQIIARSTVVSELYAAALGPSESKGIGSLLSER